MSPCLQFASFAVLLLSAPVVGAGELDPTCVLRLTETADDSMTVAEIRQACRAAGVDGGEEARTAATEEGAMASGLVEQRLAAEREAAARRFSIMAHKPNYFLAAAYNTEGWNSAESLQDDGGGPYASEDLESQFQVSLKVPLAVGLFGDRIDVYGAYTNR